MTEKQKKRQQNSSPEGLLHPPHSNAAIRHAEAINRVLFSIANAVNTTLNLDDLYKTIHKALGTIIDVTNFFIAIVDSHNKTLYFPYYVDTVDDDFSPIGDFDTESSLTGLVVLQKKPILLQEKDLQERALIHGIWGPMPLTWIGVPLMIRDEVIGVIAVQSYTHADTYSHKDLEILAAVSHQTAMAIDRKRSIENLKKSEERRIFALQATNSGIWDWNIETGEIFLDDNHYRMAGYHPGEYPPERKEWEKRIHPDDYPSTKVLLKMIKDGLNTSYRSEYRYKSKNGDWLWILSQGKVITWTEGNKPARFIGTHTNISKQKKAEEKQKQSEKTYRNIFLNAQIGLFRINTSDLKLLECNDAIAKMLGYENRHQCLANFSALRAYTSKKSLRTAWKKLKRDGEVKNDVAQFYRQDGSIAWFRLSAKVYEQKNYLEGVVEDITDFIKAKQDKQLLQQKLDRSKKMEALGLLAGSVAHDLNNILSGIISYPELMLLTIDENSELRGPITAIQDSGKRAATVVNDLLTIARSAASVKEARCINTIIRDYIKSPEFLQYQKEYPNLKIHVKLQAEPSNILCSSVHITKSIMNLVTNGIEAVHGNGAITIASSNSSNGKLTNKYDDIVVVTIHDTGPGISSRNISHIFEPFYTQKIMGKSGTGLGLTVVWNTMEDHNGEVLVDSNERGTIFTLVFPVCKEEVSKAQESFKIEDHKGRGQHILIVDDEAQLREIASHLLTSMGYKCNHVSSGEAAINYLKENHADLVLLDMLMEPGLNGKDTYQQILKFRPTQKAIITSGYSESKDVELALKLGVGAFVKKPYSLEQLSVAVEKILR